MTKICRRAFSAGPSAVDSPGRDGTSGRFGRRKFGRGREGVMSISEENGHSRCVFCGDRNPRSLRLNFQANGDGAVRGRFRMDADLRGYENTAHGGIAAGLLDAAMTHCLFHRGIRAVTGGLHVRYVRPLACPASLEIRAWILSSRPPLHRLRAEIANDGQVTTWAEGTFVQGRS